MGVWHPAHPTLRCDGLGLLPCSLKLHACCTSFELAALLPEFCTWISAQLLSSRVTLGKVLNIFAPYFLNFGSKDTMHVIYLRGLLALHKWIYKKFSKRHYFFIKNFWCWHYCPISATPSHFAHCYLPPPSFPCSCPHAYMFFLLISLTSLSNHPHPATMWLTQISSLYPCFWLHFVSHFIFFK